ncbi:phosphotransferase [Streptacidiphilus sp. 4-A2]|nr:phosphotransferase [Streptacidiphilus sp. 4-A2]
MDDRYERFSIADPLYYDEPSRAESPGDWYPTATAALPDGWVRSYRSPWTVLLPPHGMVADQGWKIHVSTTPDGTAQVIETVVGYCQQAGIPVKFLRSRQSVTMMNSKYANRRSSGKTLTLYPPDEAALKAALDELSIRLEGAVGAYVLSDLRWREGPLHVRYGSFIQRWCTNEKGERVLARRGADGVLVPDVRDTFFTPPPDVELPGFLADQIARNTASEADHHLPFQVEKALHFSNGGGIYLATDERDGRRVVLREARPHAGLDATGADAVTRLHRERAVLRELDDLDFVPRLYEYRQVWEHHYLVEEYIEGEQLEAEFSRRCPLTKPAPDPQSLAEYTGWALDVVAQLEVILGRLHERGMVFGDLHPNNVLIRPDGRVALVDFELAFRCGNEHGPALGAFGFTSPAARRGTAVDDFALAAIRLYLFLPQNLLLPLDSSMADRVADLLPQLYPVSADFGRTAAAALHRAAGGRLPAGNTQAAGGPQTPPWPTAGAGTAPPGSRPWTHSPPESWQRPPRPDGPALPG